MNAAPPHACEWCNAPATVERTIVPERRDAEKNLVKPGLKAWVCEVHSQMVDRNEEISALNRRRRVQTRRIGHPKYQSQQQAVHATIAKIDARLAELGERTAA